MVMFLDRMYSENHHREVYYKHMAYMQNKRIWIKGLVMECPHGVPAYDCPLNALRHLPIAEANRVINNMPESSVNGYLLSHRQCYNHRLKSFIVPAE